MTNAVAIELAEYNPYGVEVTEVHAVISAHFDAGCKTPGCGKLVGDEPDRCAAVGPRVPNSNAKGEPWAYHILNRYFDQFISDAIGYAKMTPLKPGAAKYKYMIQPWVVALFLDCENSGIASWDGSGFPKAGMPVLHCPNQTAINDLKLALKRGDLYMNAFAHNAEASYYPDSDIFVSALKVGADIADELGIDRAVTVSQRDVPGWTRAALPLLKANGIIGLSFGAGTPPGKPDTPPLFVWRDEASDTDMVTTYETAYGTASTVFVLPNGVALAACWDGDNRGAPPIDFAQGAVDQISQKYSGANVTVSTFDAFFKIANQADIKSQLPVVTSEIGDGWIYGVPSDPLKNAQFREACRLRKECIESKQCDATSPAMKAYDRLLVKIPEHTWGVAQAWFLPDYTNYTNTQFDKARAQQGFVKNNTLHADYNTTMNSWLEQRSYVLSGPDLLRHEQPALAAKLETALEELANPVIPTVDGFDLKPSSSTFTCGNLKIEFGSDGSLTKLENITTAKSWATESNRIGVYQYQSFTNADYDVFLQDFAIRLGGGCAYQPGAKDDKSCGNFRKPNMSAANPIHRDITGTLTAVYQQQQQHQQQPKAQQQHSADTTSPSCVFITNISFATEAVVNAGAPPYVLNTIKVSDSGVDFDVIAVNKRPTRLPEAMFFTFNPVAKVDSWTLQVLGSSMDPTDTFGSQGNGSLYGGSPHLKGIESASATAAETSEVFTVSSLDVPVVAIGSATPFPTPRNQAPDMTYGISYNIFQNIWNTNYVLWYPFVEEDKNIRSRFSFSF